VSIITEALKRAEEDKVIKEKEAAELALSGIALEAAKESEVVVQEHIEERRPAPEPVAASGTSRFLNRLGQPAVIGGLLLLAFLALWAIPQWPMNGGGLSLKWNPFGGAQTVTNASIERTETATIAAPETAAPLPYVLTGITVVDGDRFALVNDQIVTVGDSVDGAFITEILDREVVLETRAGEIRLKIRN
jgi:hypothetical protein